MPFHGAEWAWNSVDVRGEDGLLHSGRVIDAVEGGLIVDFGGRGQLVPRLFPFGDVYYRCFNTHLTIRDVKRPVEVLLRLQPGDPWKWYPGVLLHDFGLVCVTRGDRKINGVMIRQRIREPSDLADLRVTKGQFAKHLVVVPSEIGASMASDDQLISRFNAHCQRRNYWMMATHVLGDSELGEVRMLAIMETALPYPLNSWQYSGVAFGWPEPPDKILLSLLKCDENALNSSRLLTPATPCPDIDADSDIRFIYRDPTILPQIFECLTTFQQNKLRGICRQWYSALAVGYLRRVVTLSAPLNDPDSLTGVYRFASFLYHYWTQHTRVLVFDAESAPHLQSGARLRDLARFLQRVQAVKRLPAVLTLVLVGEWRVPVDAANWVHAVWEVLLLFARVCRQIVLKNVGVYLEIEGSNRVMQPRVVRIAHQRITPQLNVKDFLTMLNDGLCELSTTKGERVSQSTASTSASITVPQHSEKVSNINHQDGVPSSGVSVFPDGQADIDGVGARQVNKLTLHTLFYRQDDKDRRNVVQRSDIVQAATSHDQGVGPQMRNLGRADGDGIPSESATRETRETGRGIKRKIDEI